MAPAHGHSPAATLLFVLLSLTSGALLSVQSRINGALAQELDDSIAAAAISFGVGLVVMLLVCLIFAPARRAVRRVPSVVRRREFPRWYLLAGTVGAMIVIGQATAVPLIGVALFTVSMVTGQAVGSMILDRIGFAGAEPRLIRPLRVVGVVFTLVGVIWAVNPFGTAVGLSTIWPMIFTLGIGLLIGFQSASNGAQAGYYGSAAAATLVNFCVGLLLLLAIMAVRWVAGGVHLAWPEGWWYYVGGALGTIFVGVTALVVKRLGVLVAGLAAVGGQLVGSLLLDIFLPAAGTHVGVATVGGTVLTLAAVAVASISGSRAVGARAQRIS